MPNIKIEIIIIYINTLFTIGYFLKLFWIANSLLLPYHSISIKVTKIKTIEGLRYDNSGQFINLEDLNKVDKENLKNALNTIKDLEELIKDNFQLTQFS